MSLPAGKKIMLVAVCALLSFVSFIPFKFSGAGDPMATCIFCDIIGGKVPQTMIERETNEYVIFKDIKPASTHHYLAVPKRHIDSLKSLSAKDNDLITHMEAGLKEVFISKGIDTNDALFGFHLPPFISVNHLHMHGIAPRSTMNFFNRTMFRPGSMWFKNVEEARNYIKDKI